MDEAESYCCGESDRIYSEVVNLPSSVGLSEIDQMRVVEVIAESSAKWAAGEK
jgi:dTDP-4-amino-4,6-dideoxygalactose transaminase